MPVLDLSHACLCSTSAVPLSASSQPYMPLLASQPLLCLCLISAVHGSACISAMPLLEFDLSRACLCLISSQPRLCLCFCFISACASSVTASERANKLSPVALGFTALMANIRTPCLRSRHLQRMSMCSLVPGGQWTDGSMDRWIDGSMEVGTTQSINTEVWSGRIEDGLLQERSQSAEGVEHKDVCMDVCFFRKPSLLPLLRASSSPSPLLP